MAQSRAVIEEVHGIRGPSPDCTACSYPIFRFMNLPPELRDHIYAELLILDYESYTAHPQILAASRQTYREGYAVLYGVNTFNIRLEGQGIYALNERCMRSLSWGVSFHAVSGHSYSFYPCITRDATWPDFLRRAQYIHITGGECDSEGIYQSSDLYPASINNLFYSLCSFLTKANSVKRLSVRLRGRHEYAMGEPQDVSIDMLPAKLVGPTPQLLLNGRPVSLLTQLPQVTGDTTGDYRSRCGEFIDWCYEFHDTLERDQALSRSAQEYRTKELLRNVKVAATRVFHWPSLDDEDVYVTPNPANEPGAITPDRPLTSIEALRQVTDMSPNHMDSVVWDKINELLHYDIERKVADLNASKYLPGRHAHTDLYTFWYSERQRASQATEFLHGRPWDDDDEDDDEEADGEDETGQVETMSVEETHIWKMLSAKMIRLGLLKINEPL